ncbi:aspartate aminotransferase [Saccharata proteae CBS 121410]|uniref:Aspartate aminotransferase n=1 Tax=Saccharata proteae CBS 121410 TaxID=1314787 RepID=A0A9P4HNS1_9PEZI|nr:aspartate aminotransferase [Saccharata proteae CBS 121410]
MGSLPVSELSRFAGLEECPMDEAFAIMQMYALDQTEGKVSLGAGVYRDDDEKPWVLPTVRKAEKLLASDDRIDHEYQPMTGYAPFVSAARDLIFGNPSPALTARIASVQTISGTGACHLGAHFLGETLKPRNVWISDPTWSNHHLIWTVSAPNVQQRLYPYYNATTRSLDFDNMMATLENDAQPGDIVLLHACAHNPTGLDPTKAQWQRIADVCEARNLFPFFDSAYQGFASGDLDQDAWAIRHFASRNLELCVAQSFSKNFGLYGQRVGAFHLLTGAAEVQPGALSQVVRVIRGEISTTPVYGARIVAEVLNTPALRKEWYGDLRVMSSRLKAMRAALYAELVRLDTPGTWDHIVNQIGMFSYTGLSEKQVRRLKEDFHMYLMATGRASIAGLNSKNVASVAAAIDAVVRADSTP